MENNQKIGNLLQSAREKQNIGLDDIANKTKININILKALESEDLSTLPNKTYVKGFVRNYAKTVGVDTEVALAALENTYGTEKELNTSAPQVENLETYEEKEAKVELEELQDSLRSVITSFVNKKIFISVAAVIILYILGRGFVSFFMNLSQEQKSMSQANSKIEEIQDNEETIKGSEESLFNLAASKKLNQENAQEDTKSEKVENLPVTKVEKAAIVAPTEKRVEKKVIAEAKIEAKEEVEEDTKTEPVEVNVPAGKFPFKKFYPAPTELYSILEDAKENSDEQLIPRNIKNSMDDDYENVYIKATSGDTWLSYQVDDEDIKRFVLKEGRAILIKGKTILLFMGNLNATHVFYNNKLIDAPTKTGVKSLIFPESEAKNYELPLFPSYKGVPQPQKKYKENMMDAPSA